MKDMKDEMLSAIADFCDAYYGVVLVASFVMSISTSLIMWGAIVGVISGRVLAAAAIVNAIALVAAVAFSIVGVSVACEIERRGGGEALEKRIYDRGLMI